MILWIIALCILIVGGFITTLIKQNKYNLIVSIILFLALIPLIKPIWKVIQVGNMLIYDSNSVVLFQRFSSIIDPNTAFFILSSIIICLIYALSKIFDKASLKLDMKDALLVIGTVFFSIAIIGINNCSYMLALMFIVPPLIQICRQKFSLQECKTENNTISLVYSYISLMIFTFAILLFAISSSNGINFDSIINVLQKTGKEFKEICYLLIFLSTALPAVLCDKLLSSNNINKEYYKEYFLIKNLLYTTFIYIFIRFVGIGALPQAFGRYFTLIILCGIILFSLFKIIKNYALKNFLFNYNLIGKSLSVLGVIIATFGYSFDKPIVAILGLTSSFLFFVNTILSDIMLSFEDYRIEKNSNITINKNFLHSLKISLYSYSGVPLTIGFACWISVFGALVLGLMSKTKELQMACLLTLILLIIILLTVWFTSYNVITNISDNENLTEECKKEININRIISLCSATLIIIFGILLKFVLKFIFCPISLMVGGTKFVEIFNSLENLAAYYSIFAILTVIITILYIFIKIVVYKLLQKD